MKRLLAMAALVVAASVGSAQAEVITFEDLALDGAVPGGDRTSGGFFFDSVVDHTHIDDGSNWGTTNGSKILVIDAFNSLANNVTFSPTGGGPFTLTSIDLSKANTFSTTSALNVVVTGNLSGGGTVSRTIALPDYSFTTFTFDSSWTNLLSVVLNGTGATCCGTPPGNYYAVDNIGVAAAAVPEPATLSLLGLGAAFVVNRRRRNGR